MTLRHTSLFAKELWNDEFRNSWCASRRCASSKSFQVENFNEDAVESSPESISEYFKINISLFTFTNDDFWLILHWEEYRFWGDSPQESIGFCIIIWIWNFLLIVRLIIHLFFALMRSRRCAIRLSDGPWCTWYYQADSLNSIRIFECACFTDTWLTLLTERLLRWRHLRAIRCYPPCSCDDPGRILNRIFRFEILDRLHISLRLKLWVHHENLVNLEMRLIWIASLANFGSQILINLLNKPFPDTWSLKVSH